MTEPDVPSTSGSRRARLERLVYGAEASEEERAAAERELAALQRDDARAGADASTAAVGEATDAPPGPAPAAESEASEHSSGLRALPDATAGVTSAPPKAWYRSRTLLVAASAAVFGLAIGGLAGWQLSRAASADGTLGTPVVGSGAAALLDRSSDFDDRPAIFDAESGIDRDSLRRIASVDSGVVVYGSRSTDGKELCLALIWERMGGGGSTCTHGGRIPPNGLSLEMGTNDPAVENGLITLRASWFADGTVQIGIPLL